MSIPRWITTAGLLGTINEREQYTKTLSVDDSDSLTFSVIAGALPPGLILSDAGTISGFPLEVSKRTEYQFVVRATDGTYNVDSTFKLIVEGSDAPVWSTPAGQIGTVRDGDYFRFQLEAIDSDSDIKSYSIIDGLLPPALSLDTNTGLITGVTLPVQQVDFDSSQIGYSGQPYDTVVFDQSARSGSIDANYEFTVRVSDGISHSDRTFSLFVEGLSSLPKADNTTITADTTSTFADSDEIRDLYFVQPAGSLGEYKHQNYAVIHIDVVDPGDYLEYSGDTTITYSLDSGTLPPGLSLNSTTGEIYGTIGYSQATTTTYNFTVSALKSSIYFLDSVYSRDYSITILGEAYNDITWDTTIKEIQI